MILVPAGTLTEPVGSLALPRKQILEITATPRSAFPPNHLSESVVAGSPGTRVYPHIWAPGPDLNHLCRHATKTLVWNKDRTLPVKICGLLAGLGIARVWSH